MKKSGFLILLFLLISVVSVFAEDYGTTVDAQANSTMSYEVTDQSKHNYISSPIITDLTPDIGTPFVYRNQSGRQSSFDEDFNIKEMTSLFDKNVIKLDIVRSYSYHWRRNKAISTKEVAIDRNGTEIELLTTVPQGKDIWQTSFVRFKKNDEDESLERLICTYLKQAYDASDESRYFSIHYEVSDFSQVDQKGLGGGAVFSHSSGGDKAISSGLTIGKAKAKGNVFKGGYFEITFWNKGKSDTVQEHQNLMRIGRVDNIGDVFFDFDSSEIKHDSQIKAIKQITDGVEILLKDIQPNMTLFFLGSASEEGTIRYNKELGKKRAHAVYLIVMRNLHQRGYDLDKIGETIQFDSKGELFPDSIHNEKNRKTSLYVITNP